MLGLPQGGVFGAPVGLTAGTTCTLSLATIIGPRSVHDAVGKGSWYDVLDVVLFYCFGQKVFNREWLNERS